MSMTGFFTCWRGSSLSTASFAAWSRRARLTVLFIVLGIGELEGALLEHEEVFTHRAEREGGQVGEGTDDEDDTEEQDDEEWEEEWLAQRLIVKDTRLLGRKLAAGSRIVMTLGVVKQPDRQLNLGSGKEPTDETVADAGEPLEIRWRGSSYLDLPIHELP